MRLPDWLRYGLAVGFGAVIFYYLFVTLDLQFWLCSVVALAVYFVVLFIFRPALRADQIRLGARVTKADLLRVDRDMKQAELQLGRIATEAQNGDQAMIEHMKELVDHIRQSVLADPDDYRLTRQFINVYLPKIIGNVNDFVSLSQKASKGDQSRVDELRQSIQGHVGVMERLNRACLENDFRSIELETSVLDEQLKKY